MQQSYTFIPRDLLFFRDGRPIDVDKGNKDSRSVGHGANWPRPDHLYNGVMHALLNNQTASERLFRTFGSLKITGPFPQKGDTLYLPRPLDWDCQLVKVEHTDLPPFLTHGFIDNQEGKKDYPAWIPLDVFKAYLAKVDLKTPSPALSAEKLFQTEARTGTTLNAATGASERTEGKISGQYTAEYLRLEKGVSLWGTVECKEEELAQAVGGTVPETFILGGQGGLVRVEASARSLIDELPKPTLKPMPEPAADGAFYVRWTLLTPAYFSQTGWLPGWCKDTSSQQRPEGEVCLPDCSGCRLIAAFTGKPIVFSGWDSETGVKPTKLAVPAGSCYVFKCPDAEKAEKLVNALHLQRKSDFGSQGFGIGVCSFINLSFQ